MSRQQHKQEAARKCPQVVAHCAASGPSHMAMSKSGPVIQTRACQIQRHLVSRSGIPTRDRGIYRTRASTHVAAARPPARRPVGHSPPASRSHIPAHWSRSDKSSISAASPKTNSVSCCEQVRVVFTGFVCSIITAGRGFLYLPGLRRSLEVHAVNKVPPPLRRQPSTDLCGGPRSNYRHSAYGGLMFGQRHRR